MEDPDFGKFPVLPLNFGSAPKYPEKFTENEVKLLTDPVKFFGPKIGCELEKIENGQRNLKTPTPFSLYAEKLHTNLSRPLKGIPAECLLCCHSPAEIRNKGEIRDGCSMLMYFPRIPNFFSVHETCLVMVPGLEDCKDLDSDSNQHSVDKLLRSLKLESISKSVKGKIASLCSYCQGPLATISCERTSCSKAFHVPCALESGCQLDHMNFKLFCPSHIPSQKNYEFFVSGNMNVMWKRYVPKEDRPSEARFVRRPMCKNADDYNCIICSVAIEKDLLRPVYGKMIVSHCCDIAFYHFECIMNMMRARGYRTRCPHCNSEKTRDFFQSVILFQGIPLISMDPSDDNDETSQPHLTENSNCNAGDKCQCPKGVSYYDKDPEDVVQFIPFAPLNDCIGCGCNIHRKCSRYPWNDEKLFENSDFDEPQWICEDCVADGHTQEGHQQALEAEKRLNSKDEKPIKENEPKTQQKKIPIDAEKIDEAKQVQESSLGVGNIKMRAEEVQYLRYMEFYIKRSKYIDDLKLKSKNARKRKTDKDDSDDELDLDGQILSKQILLSKIKQYNKNCKRQREEENKKNQQRDKLERQRAENRMNLIELRMLEDEERKKRKQIRRQNKGNLLQATVHQSVAEIPQEFANSDEDEESERSTMLEAYVDVPMPGIGKVIAYLSRPRSRKRRTPKMQNALELSNACQQVLASDTKPLLINAEPSLSKSNFSTDSGFVLSPGDYETPYNFRRRRGTNLEDVIIITEEKDLEFSTPQTSSSSLSKRSCRRILWTPSSSRDTSPIKERVSTGGNLKKIKNSHEDKENYRKSTLDDSVPRAGIRRGRSPKNQNSSQASNTQPVIRNRCFSLDDESKPLIDELEFTEPQSFSSISKVHRHRVLSSGIDSHLSKPAPSSPNTRCAILSSSLYNGTPYEPRNKIRRTLGNSIIMTENYDDNDENGEMLEATVISPMPGIGAIIASLSKPKRRRGRPPKIQKSSGPSNSQCHSAWDIGVDEKPILMTDAAESVTSPSNRSTSSVILSPSSRGQRRLSTMSNESDFDTPKSLSNMSNKRSSNDRRSLDIFDIDEDNKPLLEAYPVTPTRVRSRSCRRVLWTPSSSH